MHQFRPELPLAEVSPGRFAASERPPGQKPTTCFSTTQRRLPWRAVESSKPDSDYGSSAAIALTHGKSGSVQHLRLVLPMFSTTHWQHWRSWLPQDVKSPPCARPAG